MNIAEILLSSQQASDPRKGYAEIVFTKIVEDFRYILDKQIGANKPTEYAATLGYLVILWINRFPPNKFKSELSDLGDSGLFLLDVALIKGVFKKTEDFFIDHFWLNCGGEILDITNPLGHELEKNRAILDIAPYLKKKMASDKKSHVISSIVNSKEADDLGDKELEIDGKKISILDYSVQLFEAKYPKN